jgi:hypothetical protein
MTDRRTSFRAFLRLLIHRPNKVIFTSNLEESQYSDPIIVQDAMDNEIRTSKRSSDFPLPFQYSWSLSQREKQVSEKGHQWHFCV